MTSKTLHTIGMILWMLVILWLFIAALFCGSKCMKATDDSTREKWYQRFQIFISVTILAVLSTIALKIIQ